MFHSFDAKIHDFTFLILYHWLGFCAQTFSLHVRKKIVFCHPSAENENRKKEKINPILSCPNNTYCRFIDEREKGERILMHFYNLIHIRCIS